MSIETIGQRIYFRGHTYPVRDRIKAIGGHWDADRRAWWVGTAKRAEAEALAAEMGDAPAASSQPSERRNETPDRAARVKGRATYKGRDYYVLAETRDGARLLLAARNGAFQFWARAAQIVGDRISVASGPQYTEGARITKTYGHDRSGYTEYPTLGSLIDRADAWRKMSSEEREMAREDAEARRNGEQCPCSGGACRCGSDSPCCMCW